MHHHGEGKVKTRILISGEAKKPSESGRCTGHQPVQGFLKTVVCGANRQSQGRRERAVSCQSLVTCVCDGSVDDSSSRASQVTQTLKRNSLVNKWLLDLWGGSWRLSSS